MRLKQELASFRRNPNKETAADYLSAALCEYQADMNHFDSKRYEAAGDNLARDVHIIREWLKAKPA